MVFESCEETCRERGEETCEDNAPKQQEEGKVEITTSSPSAPDGGLNGNYSSSPAQGVGFVKSVWAHYMSKLGKNPNLLSLTKTRMAKGLARFEEAKKKTAGDPEKASELMKLAVDAVAASPHHMGKNEQGVRYDSWEKNLFPSLEKFEWWLERVS